jgi:predicted nucleic acid-binding protein
MPELVISNTSPIFYLHRLRHLEVLQALYQQIPFTARRYNKCGPQGKRRTFETHRHCVSPS